LFQRYIQQQQQYIKRITKIFPVKREELRGGSVHIGVGETGETGEEGIRNSDA
jgi:hypothetical protein